LQQHEQQLLLTLQAAAITAASADEHFQIFIREVNDKFTAAEPTVVHFPEGRGLGA
jgi:hypothetical protein